MDNLRSVDLNLLAVLDALLDEAHVTRAAARLGLSQPATSSALDRLRHLFGDKLLERGGRGGMRLTPKAEALRPPLKAALASVRSMLHAPTPDLAAVRRTVRLVVSDIPALTLVAALHGRLSRTAPGITLAILPWRSSADAVAQLARGEAELVASVLPQLPPAFRQVALFEERYVVLMRSGHPAADGFSLHRWLSYAHIVVSARGEAATPLDAELAARGLARRVGAVVPSFLMVPALLQETDLLALYPSRGIPPRAAAQLLALPPPIPVEGFRLALAWHARSDEDVAVRHVAREAEAVLREMPSAA